MNKAWELRWSHWRDGMLEIAIWAQKFPLSPIHTMSHLVPEIHLGISQPDMDLIWHSYNSSLSLFKSMSVCGCCQLNHVNVGFRLHNHVKPPFVTNMLLVKSSTWLLNPPCSSGKNPPFGLHRGRWGTVAMPKTLAVRTRHEVCLQVELPGIGPWLKKPSKMTTKMIFMVGWFWASWLFFFLVSP